MSLSSDMAAMIQSQVAMGEGEIIEYRPHQGIPRMIPVIVDRTEPTSEFVGGGEVLAIRYQVMVAKDAITGLVGPNEGQDTFKLKVKREDLTPSLFRLARILQRDTGAYSLEVVK